MLIDNAEDFEVVTPMYNMLEYSKSYRKATDNFWNYYRDELSDDTNDNNSPNKNVFNSKSFKCKTFYDEDKSGKKEVEIAVPFKYLSNFWTALKIPLINCEVSLILTWSRDRLITSLERRIIKNTRIDTAPKIATFQITDTKLYVPVVTLSTENDKTLLAQLRTGFKRTIKQNKYRSEMTNEITT